MPCSHLFTATDSDRDIMELDTEDGELHRKRKTSILQLFLQRQQTQLVNTVKLILPKLFLEACGLHIHLYNEVV